MPSLRLMGGLFRNEYCAGSVTADGKSASYGRDVSSYTQLLGGWDGGLFGRLGINRTQTDGGRSWRRKRIERIR